jgi:hypothetical protein
MGNRSLLSLLILIILVFVIVKIDLFTKVKAGVTNMIYGNKIGEMKSLHVAVEAVPVDLEKEGLTRETIRGELSAAVEKGGVRNLTEEEWQNMPDRPTLNATINATKVAEGRYQYSVALEVIKREPLDPGEYNAKHDSVWFSSGVGEGSVADIRTRIAREMALFLKAREN